MRFFTDIEDEKIIAGLQEGGPKRSLYETKLYDRFSYFIGKAVREHAITREDASSAYSDAINSVIANIINDKFERRASLKVFTAKIFYFKCVDFFRQPPTIIGDGLLTEDLLSLLPADIQPVIDKLMDKYRSGLIKQGLENIGDNCKKILLLFEEGKTDQEIAEIMNYNTSDVAKMTRWRCIEKLRAFVAPGNHE